MKQQQLVCSLTTLYFSSNIVDRTTHELHNINKGQKKLEILQLHSESEIILCSVSKSELEFGLSFEIDGIVKNRQKTFSNCKFFFSPSAADYLNGECFVIERTTHFQTKHWT